MTSPTPRGRPHWAYRLTISASIVAAAMALTACRGGAQPDTAAPSADSTPSTTATTPAPTASAAPTVYGKLTVQIAKTSNDSVVPRPPISYKLVVTAVGSGVMTQHEVGADGEFALTLPSGTYDMSTLEIKADDLGPDPVRLPLTASEKLRFTAPATGCVYGGHVQLLYGRLPAGDTDHQAKVIGQLHNQTGLDYMFVYLPNGGFAITGGHLEMPAESDRPAAARGCTTEEFSTVPTT